MNATPLRNGMELLSSMRFAVSLLSVIGVASVIGTVVRQGEPYGNYLNQFGPFWFPLFERLGLFAVYNAWWFLAILAFLVISTSLCVSRNAPSMLREIGRWRDDLREQAFDNFAFRARFARTSPDAAARASAYLRTQGFDVKANDGAAGTLIAAKAGMYRRAGYVLAHTAIVLICIGGLADSEVALKLQLLAGSKKPIGGNLLLSEVPETSRLPASNWSFRGNTLIPEGKSSDVSVLNAQDGILVQELPFSISLKRFVVEHYSTGAPKLFASDVVVTDKDTQQSFEARIEVNKPLIHKGVAVYQASFEDGGTLLKIRPRNLLGGTLALRELEGRVGESLKLTLADAVYTLEFAGFRPLNVENVASAEPVQGSMLERMKQGLGSAAPAPGRKDMRNVGPSYSYKLRDAAGQAREYSNYMLPTQLDGRWMLLSGMRETPGEPFRFLRLPVDEAGGLDDYLRLTVALFDRKLYPEIGRRFARTAGAGQAFAGNGMSQTMRTRLQETAERVLETFSTRGFASVAEFLETNVPEPEREKAGEIYIRILQGVAWEALTLARERASLPRLEATPERARFVQDGLNAMSDTFFYGVPVYLQLAGYNEVKASVFQLTRSPGKPIVYWGCGLLVLGIFAMLYLRERRLWLLIKPDGEAKLAFSSTRRGFDIDQEFARHRAALEKIFG